MKLRQQMIVRIAGPSLVIYILILGLAGLSLHSQGLREAEQAMTRLAASYAGRLDGHLREAARVAETTASFMDMADRLSDEEVYEQLEHNVEQMALIYGAALAFEPGTRRPAGELFAPYVCREGDGLRRINIDRSVYDWYTDPRYTWYSRPRKLGRAVWSEPYFDEGAGNVLMSTYSAPFRLAGGEFGGVCTADIDLPHLRQTVGSEIRDELDFVILAADGRYVYHPDPARIMSDTVQKYAAESGRADLVALAATMLAEDEPGSAWIGGWDSEQPLGVFYATVPSTGWVFACRMPAETVLGEVRRRLVVGGGALLAALVLIGLCIYFVAGRISAPIAALERRVDEVSRGELDARIDESASTGEIRTLARSFNKMTSDLRATVDHLAAEQSARQRIEGEMGIAREIQQGLLPKSPPQIAGFEIAGWSKAADQTGGDYYDWIVLPNGRAVIVIADAAGHGIGSALVIAACRAFFRAAMYGTSSIAAAMRRVNGLLMNDMPAGLFVTAALCMVDPEDGSVEIFSAGHGPILLYSAATGGIATGVTDEHPLGIAEMGEGSRPVVRSLAAGDLVVLITDGFFEWQDGAGVPYGIPGLERFIRANHGLAPEEFIRSLHADVLRHAGGTVQEDDLTIVIVKRT